MTSAVKVLGRIFRKTGISISAFFLVVAGSQAAFALDLEDTAPDFTLKSNQGSNIRLGDLRGEVVMINFWATWCGPCLQEMPLLDELYQKYESAGFTLLGINVEETQDKAKVDEMLGKLQVSFPVLYDTGSIVSEMYSVDAMPSTIFVDRAGNFRYLHRGYKPGDEEGYKKIIQALIRM